MTVMIFRAVASSFFNRGYRSRRGNLSLYPSNPYHVHSRAYEEWFAGWRAADEEMIGDLRKVGMVLIANDDACTHDTAASSYPIVT
jgi:hypothetical protein